MSCAALVRTANRRSRRARRACGEQYDGTTPPTGSDKALGLVDFTLHPHLNAEYMLTASLAHLEKWATGVDVPAYAIDDQTALKVIDGVVEVVSEGQWKRFTP
jgi:dipeptidase E